MYREAAGVVSALSGLPDIERGAALNALELGARVIAEDPSLMSSVFSGLESVVGGGHFSLEDYRHRLPASLERIRHRKTSSLDQRSLLLLARVLERRDSPLWLREVSPWEDWIGEAGREAVIWGSLALGGKLRPEDLEEAERNLEAPNRALRELFALSAMSIHTPLPPNLVQKAWKLARDNAYIDCLLSLLHQSAIPLAEVLELLVDRRKGGVGDPRWVEAFFPVLMERLAKRPMEPEEVLEGEVFLKKRRSPYFAVLWAHPAYPIANWEDKLPWALLHPSIPKELLLKAVRGEGRFSLTSVPLHEPPNLATLAGRNPSLSLEDLAKAYEDPWVPGEVLLAWRRRLAKEPKGQGPRVSKEGARFFLRKAPSQEALLSFALHPEVSLEEAESEVAWGGPHRGLLQVFLALRGDFLSARLSPLLKGTPFFYPVLAVREGLPREWGEREVDKWRRGELAREVGGL